MDNNMYYNVYNDDEEEIDIIELLKFLLKHVLVIVLIGIAGLIIGGGFAYIKNAGMVADDSYVSNVSIYCAAEYETEDYEKAQNIQTALMKDYCEFAMSRTVIENAISESGIDKTYDEVSENVTAEVKGSNILNIQAKDTDPLTAYMLASSVAGGTIECIKACSDDVNPVIFEEANIPTTPSIDEADGEKAEPKSVKKYALIGLIAGLFIGCCIYGLIYLLSDKILVEYDIERFLRLKVLAVIKKGESVETAVNSIRKEQDFIAMEIDDKKTQLDDYVQALKNVKENENIIVIVKTGTHGKAAQKSLEKIQLAGGKTIGAIFVEA